MYEGQLEGQLEGFPKEIVEKMLEYQVAQGNKRDVSVFETNKINDKSGFDWRCTTEGWEFWNSVIAQKCFDLFFKKYPKTRPYPKVMRVSDDEITENNRGIERVVFMEKCGKFLAWENAKTLEEAEKVIGVISWEYAKDIEPENPENPQKQELLLKAEELIKKAEEWKEAANKL